MGTIAVAWWNLENLFDTDDDPISQDFEFTTANGWTDDVYAAKRANLAAVLNKLHAGNGPELLGVAEVEGDDVFAQLLADTGNPHFKVVTDPRPPPARPPTCGASMCPSPTTTASSAWSTRPPTWSTCAIPPGTSSRSPSRSQIPATPWW